MGELTDILQSLALMVVIVWQLAHTWRHPKPWVRPRQVVVPERLATVGSRGHVDDHNRIEEVLTRLTEEFPWAGEVD